MKKNLFLLMVSVLVTTTAFSQIRLGAKAGVNLSRVTSHSSFKDDNVTGFHIGPSAEWLINGTFGIEGALLYSQKGLKFENGTQVSTNKVGYLEIPLSLKYKLNAFEAVRPYLTAGPYINFKVDGDDTFNDMNNSLSEQWKAKSFGAGLTFSAGVELFKFLQVGARYDLGLTDNYKQSDGDYSVQDRTWSAVVGVYF